MALPVLRPGLSHTRRCRVPRGYTATELAVTLALVAILAGIAVPGWQSYRAKADQRRTAQQITMMQTRIQSYRDDTGAWPNSLADVGLDSQRDPWGQAYGYYNIEANGKGHARKDKHLNPINSDYDLFSPGPDGVWKNQLDHKDSVDDVVRARNGAYVGVSADF